jgi:hypothetical protein
MAVADNASADKEPQSKVTVVYYPRTSGNVSTLSFTDMLDTMATLREDFIDVLSHFNPDKALQMEQKNELIRDLIQILDDLPRKNLKP